MREINDWEYRKKLAIENLSQTFHNLRNPGKYNEEEKKWIDALDKLRRDLLRDSLNDSEKENLVRNVISKMEDILVNQDKNIIESK